MRLTTKGYWMSKDQRLQWTDQSIITNGAALGSSVRVGGAALVGLILDSAWDTNIITFQTSVDGTNWFPIYLDDANTELQIPNTSAVASRAITMNTVLDKLAAFNYIRPRSGTTASPANQVGQTVITFVLKA